MKPKRSTKLLEEQLTNLRDRIPLQAGVCKSDDLSFFSLLYLIMMQTLGVVLFSIYTLINFCTIILSVVKFFLGWVINLLQTSSKSSILIKLFVITLELMALIFLVYKIASLIFVPIIGVQLTVATRLVQGEKEDAKGALAGNETQTEEGADMKAESSQMEGEESQEDIAQKDQSEGAEET